MGAYLSEPVTDKACDGGENVRLRYGASTMQGWRINQEDAHSAILDYGNDSSFFAVYDGHGGPEVAEYAAKYLPDYIKSLEPWSEGRVGKALEEGLVSFDENLKEDKVLEELKVIADEKKPKDTDNNTNESSHDPDVVEDDDEDKMALIEEACLPLEEVLRRYGYSLGGGAARHGGGSPGSIFISPFLKGKKKRRMLNNEKETESEIPDGAEVIKGSEASNVDGCPPDEEMKNATAPVDNSDELRSASEEKSLAEIARVEKTLRESSPLKDHGDADETPPAAGALNDATEVEEVKESEPIPSADNLNGDDGDAAVVSVGDVPVKGAEMVKSEASPPATTPDNALSTGSAGDKTPPGAALASTHANGLHNGPPSITRPATGPCETGDSREDLDVCSPKPKRYRSTAEDNKPDAGSEDPDGGKTPVEVCSSDAAAVPAPRKADNSGSAVAADTDAQQVTSTNHLQEGSNEDSRRRKVKAVSAARGDGASSDLHTAIAKDKALAHGGSKAVAVAGTADSESSSFGSNLEADGSSGTDDDEEDTDYVLGQDKEPGSDDNDDDDDDDEDEDYEDSDETASEVEESVVVDSSMEVECDDDDENGTGDVEDDSFDEMQFPMPSGDTPGVDSGTTACIALVKDSTLFVANAGDTRCVLSRAGNAIDLSIDHKPEDEKEKERIERAGGRITGDGRVNGGLNLSRAIGDHFYKRNDSLPLRDQMITALPDIVVHSVTEDDEFLLLACDGIWNSMTSAEAISFVRERLQVSKCLETICEELCDHCLAPNTIGDGTGCDNMTAIIVQFLPVAKSLTSPPASSTAVDHHVQDGVTVAKDCSTAEAVADVELKSPNTAADGGAPVTRVQEEEEDDDKDEEQKDHFLDSSNTRIDDCKKKLTQGSIGKAAGDDDVMLIATADAATV